MTLTVHTSLGKEKHRTTILVNDDYRYLSEQDKLRYVRLQVPLNVNITLIVVEEDNNNHITQTLIQHRLRKIAYSQPETNDMWK